MSFLMVSLMSTVFYIGNQWIYVGVTDETQTVRAGSISYFLDHWTSTQMAGANQFSGVNTGSWIPANGDITVVNDTTLIFHTDHFTDGSVSLPLDFTVTYTVVNRGLEMEYRFEYLQDCEFWDPLDIDFYIADWSSIEISNQTTVDEEFTLDGSTGFQRFSGDQIFELTGGSNPEAMFVLPNVSKGLAVVNDLSTNSYMSVRVLDTEEPRENAMGPVLHSIIEAGQVDEVFIRFSMDEFFSPVFLSGHLNGAERSSAWIMDELAFLHPIHGYMWGISEDSLGEEGTSAALICLLQNHPSMKMNWLLLPDGILDGNRDSVWFEPGYEDSWSHWHGTWRFSTEAPPEYLQWMRDIQDNVYSWSDRVRMGSHGYHHTPNPDSSFGQFHEFITYEPAEHQERFRVNFQDINACGLDTNMVRIIRFSGHRTSLSGLQAVIDHGFTFYCNGWRLIDWYAGKQFRNQWINRYQTVNGRIWGSNTVWWGDYQTQQPTEYLAEVMEKGKFGLLGCHPYNMLNVWQGDWDPVAYARIDSIMTSIEEDYDNFLWLFPEEYGNFLEDCFNIRVNSIDGSGSILSMELTGSIPQGLTFCASLHPDDVVTSVTLDGTPISWELRSGGRLFAVAPETSYGDHTVSISITPLGIEDENHGGTSDGSVLINVQSPCAGEMLEVNIQGLQTGSAFNLMIIDIAGRVVVSQQEIYSCSDYTIHSSGYIPSGVYFVTVNSGETMASARTVVIH